MARISKLPEERREEIIAASQKCFLEKGYQKTKISDIVRSIGVSQGIFYYYFPSKDTVIDAILDRYMDMQLSAAKKILDNEALAPLAKMEQMADRQLAINQQENNAIHAIKGVDIHDRLLKRFVHEYVPLLVQAFGEKRASQPDLKMELFTVAANMLFDPGIFTWTKEERNTRITFLISFMEESLALPCGSLDFYKKLMGYID